MTGPTRDHNNARVVPPEAVVRGTEALQAHGWALASDCCSNAVLAAALPVLRAQIANEIADKIERDIGDDLLAALARSFAETEGG
jgi:hypothetical protein